MVVIRCHVDVGKNSVLSALKWRIQMEATNVMADVPLLQYKRNKVLTFYAQ